VDGVRAARGGRGSKIFKKGFFLQKNPFLKILLPLEVFLFSITPYGT
jgi:hypothetical protein